MIDEAVANQTTSGAEVRKVKPSKIERSSPTQDSLWFESSSGAAFVQHLLSELDKFVNVESDIDKILRSRCLEFSFLHHQIRWVLRFPPDFPRQNLIIERGNTVIVPRANQKHAKGHSCEYQVIETLRKHCLSCNKRNK